MYNQIFRVARSTLLLGTLFAGASLATEKPQPTLSQADCDRLMAFHFDKQANPAALGLAAACRGERTQPLLYESPILAPVALSPRLGGSDLNLISDDETALVPSVTQAGSMAWGEGTDIVVVYNDTLGLPDSFSGMSVSTDSGANFTRLDPDPFGSVFTADMGSPAVAYDAAGATWYAVVLTSDCGAQGIGVMTSTTPETSGSWAAASPACAHTGTADDRPILWVDNNSSSTYYGRVYVAFNDFAAGVDGDLKVVYLDSGSWTEVTVDTNFIRNVHLTGSDGSDGSVHIFGMDEGGGGGASRLNWVYRSIDGGANWTGVQPGPSYPPAGAGLCSASDYFYMIPPVWRHMGWGQGAVSAGPTNAAGDNILHYVWARAGQVPGDLGDIYYIRSTDNGANWSSPTPLNTDQQLNNNVVQWLPSISVTSQGLVLASWLDRRNTTDGLNYEVYGRVSLDNGVTFQPDERISDAPIPQPTQVDPALADCFAGDSNFHGVVSNDSLVTWTDGRNALPLTGGGDPVSQMDVYFSRVPLCPEIDVTPDILPDGELTVAYSEMLSASGGTGPYTFALAGSLPDGLGLAGDVISGTPTTASITSFSIVATDAFGCEGSQAYSLIVNPTGCPAIDLDPADLLDGDQGAPYSDTVTASGGTGPYAYSVTAADLPTGLTIDPASGEISGSPQESGTFDINVSATDANTCTGTRSYSFNIACPTITLLPAEQLADAFAGEPYLDNITGNGGTPPYTYEVVTGTTHTGVFLGEGGTIFGMTQAGGTKQFRIVATDANGCFNASSHQFRVDSFNCFDGALLCDDLGDLNNFTVTDLCGADAEWYPTNACPSSNDIAHTPSAHARWGTNGDCLDYGTTATQDTLTSVEIDSSVCTTGEVILDFNYLLSFDGNPDSERARVEVVADGGATQVVADNGGTDGPTCSGEANAGLGNLKSWSGWQHLQMTLPAASTFQVSFVGETDDGSTAVASTDGFEGFLVDDVHVRCKCPDDFEVTPTLLEPAIVGTPYSVQFETTGGREPYTYGTLPGSPTPAGLILDPATGVLETDADPLTNLVPGIHEFTLVVKDANFCEIRIILSLIVSPAACPSISLAPDELPDEEEGVFYSQLLTPTGVTGPDPIFTLTAGALPPGLSLSPTLGVISGTPNTPGIYQFTTTVVDELTFCSGSQDYSVIINPVGCPVIEVFPEVLANAPSGEPYAQMFTATGGVAPYSWFLSAGDLPEGLTLDEASGVVSGVALSDGMFSFAITAQDENGCFGTRSYGLELMNFPPRVTRVQTVSDTGDGQLVDLEGTHHSFTQFYVTFNEEVQDPAGDTDTNDVTNPANYLLVGRGPDGLFGTTTCATGVGGDDVAVSVDQVTFDLPDLTARLRINGGVQLPRDRYRLLVCGTTSIEDILDVPLDGDGDGNGGDDMTLEFSITADNLLQNPNFDDDLAGWTASSPGETAHSQADADRAPTSGSVALTNLTGAGHTLTLSQCVTVTDEQGYFLAGRIRVDSGLDTDPNITGQVEFFDDVACGGSLLGTGLTPAFIGDTAGGGLFCDGFESGNTSAWAGGNVGCGSFEKLTSGWVSTPTGAVSARVSFVVDAGTSPAFSVNLDDLLFFQMLFGDGFESGNTSAWSATEP